MTWHASLQDIPGAVIASRWLPALTWAAGIFVVSHLPGNEIQKAAETVEVVPLALDIVYHVVVFAVMGLLAYRTATYHLGSQGKAPYITALGFAVGYGVLDELHQYLVPGRYPAVSDVIYDSAGAVAGLLALAALKAVLSFKRRTAA